MFRKTDIIGRFGGDEFIVFVQNIEDEKALRDKADTILRISVDGFI